MINYMNDANDKIIVDNPWNGFPEKEWNLNGYNVDDAICDHIMMARGRYDGIHFKTAEEALQSLLDLIRSRQFDVK